MHSTPDWRFRLPPTPLVHNPRHGDEPEPAEHIGLSEAPYASNNFVVFVHGFISDPNFWESFVTRLEDDDDLVSQGYRFTRGTNLVKIRCVIPCATPNLGSTILRGLAGIFSIFRENPQEEDLRVLDKDVAKISAVILRSVLRANSAD